MSAPHGAARGRGVARRAKRVRPGPLKVDVHAGPSGTLLDLSELGALLDLPAPHDVDSCASFDLHSDDGVVSLHGRIVRCTPRYDRLWRVAWVDPEPVSYHVAVEFFDAAEQSATTLLGILAKASHSSS